MLHAPIAAASARAGEIPINLIGLVNEPWTFPGPGAYIFNGDTFSAGSQNFGGVPFAIPASPNNYWNGGAAAEMGPGTVSVTVPVGVPGVTSAFTLLNTMWSQPGPNACVYITFTGSRGATATVPLVGGVNVRDYNNDGGQNTINNTSTIQAWTNGIGQRLDRQEYILPIAFAGQTLASVTITDTGNEDFSRVAFAGLTVSTCHAIVTESIAISTGTIIYHQGLKLYTHDVGLTNDGTAAVTGPVYLIFEDLSAEWQPLCCRCSRGIDAGSQYYGDCSSGIQRPLRSCDYVHASHGQRSKLAPRKKLARHC